MKFEYLIFIPPLFPQALASPAVNHQITSFVKNIAGKDLLNTHLKKKNVRKLEQSVDEKCDAAFMSCAVEEECADCFESLLNADIDWATVDPMTICTDVLDLLNDGGFCQYGGSTTFHDIFCSTFDSCIIWDYDEDDFSGANDDVDCNELTTCSWPGIHSAFIGDGSCQDFGCYNTAICNYDGGDCCEDKCQLDVPYEYSTCGGDGFFCRDPGSKSCNPSISSECTPDASNPHGHDGHGYDRSQCENGRPFTLKMYDSWGDGWDNTEITISAVTSPQTTIEVFKGKLENGDHGEEKICLDHGCFEVSTGGGIWGNEVLWEIHSFKGGSIPLAYGGAPKSCTFSVGQDSCENTCTGRDLDPFDEERLTYDKLSQCISEKCIVQKGLCENDLDCIPCLVDNAPAYCVTNTNYNNLVDCTLCGCAPTKPEYCSTKASNTESDMIEFDDDSQDIAEETKKTANNGQCNPDQTLSGSNAVLKFSKCTDIDQVAALINEWDENNFGPLDDFEACSHTYNNEYAHGGKKALDCMRILESITTEEQTQNRQDISALADSLYHDSWNFCQCASTANELAPSCTSFIHFKTLLHETLDACVALDEIDCASWAEFYQPCKDNMNIQFGAIDFNNNAQCEFISTGCGGVGPFPAFRELNCGSEIPKAAWDFYVTYSRSCLENNGDNNHPPKPASSPSSSTSKFFPDAPGKKPVVPATPNNPPPTPVKPYPVPAPVAPKSQENYQPYVPQSQYSDIDAPKKKKHPFFTFLFISSFLGAAVFVYKKRNEDFDFQRFRRLQRNYTNHTSPQVLYEGLNEPHAPSFEPPTLPPGMNGSYQVPHGTTGTV